MTSELESSPVVFQSILGPWLGCLRDPADAQRQVLVQLLESYRKTEYGENRHASSIENADEYRQNFPTIDFKGLNPYLGEISKGNYSAFLPEPVVCWVMTRGSTGPAKVLPATKTHLEQVFSCGARALINYAVRRRDYSILSGKILNLNFPSTVHSATLGDQTVNYGYSSGTYARLNPMLNQVSLIPRQEEIDSLGSGITKHDWEKRFELVYQRALGENVTAAMGVTPVILSFARHLHRRHGTAPKDLWKTHALFCTSVRDIQFRYAPVLRKLFGDVPVVEIYSATEGVFAQQLDDLPYVTPNYDKYFFEVETGRGTKMLHELRRGEWGRLIVSSCMFPRYDIGDLIEAAGKNYFRVFGRDNARSVLEHQLYRLFFGWYL